MWPSNPCVTSDVSEAQNCGKMDILRLRVATFSSFRACRMLKTVVKWTFWTSPSDPFVTSCVPDVENWCFCGGGGVVVVFWWCFCGGVVVCWCFCGCVFVVVFCGGVFAVVFCGGVLVVFLSWWVVFWWWWWCSGGVFVVFLWWCCGCVFVVVFLRWCSGGVFAVVFLWWCFQTSPKVLPLHLLLDLQRRGPSFSAVQNGKKGVIQLLFFILKLSVFATHRYHHFL